MTEQRPHNIVDIYPLTPLQQGMLFHTLYEPDDGLYGDQLSCRLETSEELRAETFRRAWQQVVDRHPILRTAFVWKRQAAPLQLVLRRVRVPLATEDWRGRTRSDQERELATLRRRWRKRAFDLSQPPLLRLALVRLAARDYQLLLAYHHLLMDAWSVGIVLREVLVCYRELTRGAPASTLGEAPPFRHYVTWLKSQEESPAREFWHRYLRGFVTPTPLPMLRPALAESAAGRRRFGRCETRLPAAATAALEAFARAQRVTLNTAVQGAWALLLSRYSGLPELVYGCVVSGRPDALAGMGSMVGSFINTLPARVHVAPGERLAAWLRNLQRELAELQRFAHSSLVEVQKWSGAAPGRPLFESLLVFENVLLHAGGTDPAAPMRLRQANYEARTNYPLSVAVTPDRQLRLRVSYDARRMERTAARRLLGHLAVLLEAFPKAAGRRLAELPLLSPGERQQLREWNDTETPVISERLLHQEVEAAADQAPERVAITCAERAVSYGELERRANRLARYLRRLGVAPEVRVAVCLERSPEAVMTLLAVSKAGGTTVLLDPESPPDRLAGMLDDAKAGLLLTERSLEGRLPRRRARPVVLEEALEASAGEPAVRPPAAVRPDALAYMIFTSGSTGRPKGTMNTHRGICNQLMATQEVCPLTSDDRLLHKTPYGFDVALWEIFWALSAGAGLAVARPGGHRDSAYLAAEMSRRRVTAIHFVPSMLRVFLEQPGAEACRALRHLVSGGEALTPELVERHRQRLQARLYNHYGPTETAVGVTLWRCDADSSPAIPIGRPTANVRLVVADRDLRPLPLGLPGELLIGGPQVGRGYAGAPALTAARFVPDPAGREPGGRLYRSGDRMRCRPDGAIEFLGRIDHQVKVRGFRIEPGEIEGWLRRHPAVQQAVVVARDDRPGERRLVAYLVPTSAPGPSAEELRRHLRSRLPEYMTPAFFVSLESLPLGLNGKVDRGALPAPGDQAAAPEGTSEPPRTPFEELIAGIWCEVLGAARVGVEDAFLDLGGHSLLATQVVSRIRRACGVEVPLRWLFERPTVAQLAAGVEERLQQQSGFRQVPFEPADRRQDLPLSYAQQRLWFLHQLNPQDSSYNLPVAMQLQGDLDLAALERGLNEVVRRHETLRTVFGTTDGQPVQRVRPFTPRRCLARVDLSALGDVHRAAERERLSAVEARRPFDLAAGPLLRSLLLRLAPGEHVLLVTLHHIVCDGWSTRLLLRELAVVYEALSEGRRPRLPRLSIQYPDFAAWQRRYLKGQVLGELLAYWKHQLRALPVLELPFDRPRSTAPSPHGGVGRLTIPRPLSGQLSDLSRRCGVTLFVLLLAAFKALLHAFSRQTDIVVGSDFAGRSRVETEALIGFFVNQVVLRTDLSSNPSFAELLHRVQEVMMGAYAHQDLPFDRLVEALNPDRHLALTPLFQAKFVLQNTPLAIPQVQALGVTGVYVSEHSAKFDLLFNIRQDEDGLRGSLEYRKELFDAATIECLMACYELLLRRVVARPEVRLSELSELLGEAARERLGRQELHLEEARRHKIRTVRRRMVHAR